MLVKSTVDDSTLMAIKLEGTMTLNPAEGRELLDLLSRSALAGHIVFSVGTGDVWTKLDSRWGSFARYDIEDSRVTQNSTVTTKG